MFGSLGAGGNAGRINDAKVIGAQSRGDARFLQFFQQSFVECAVAVQVALQDAVLDRALVELVRFLFLLLKGFAQHIFALQSGLVPPVEVVDGLVSFRLKLVVNLLQLVIELSDFRIRGTELGAELSNLDSETGLLFAQLVQKRGSCAGSASGGIGNDRCRDRHRIIGLGLAIDRFLLHAIGFSRRHFFVKFVELFGDDVLLIVRPKNLVLFLVAYELLLRGLHLHLQVHELFGKPVGGLHGGFELGLEVLLDISGRKGIHGAGGELGIGAVVMNLDDRGCWE